MKHYDHEISMSEKCHECEISMPMKYHVDERSCWQYDVGIFLSEQCPGPDISNLGDNVISVKHSCQ